MCKNRRKSQAMLKPFSDISFTRHSDTPRKEKKLHNTFRNYESQSKDEKNFNEKCTKTKLFIQDSN